MRSPDRSVSDEKEEPCEQLILHSCNKSLSSK